MTTRKPSTTSTSSTGAEVVAIRPDVADTPVEPSAAEIEAAKTRAQERDLSGWVNWLARPEKKIAIIGFTSSRDEAPWGQPGWEIWTCNNLHAHLRPDQQWDRLYDLHDYKTISGDKAHEAFLRTCEKPVVVWNPLPEWPSATAFPKDQALASFGRYFNNSISWMIAAAILEGVTELHIYGVDMAQGGDANGNGEYARQRPSCEWMVGMAQGRGIKVFIPETSDLMKVSALYGVDDDSPLYAKLSAREKELAGRQAQLQNQLNQGQIQLAQIMGALENTRYFRSVWTNPRGTRDEVPSNGDGKPAEAPAVGA